MELGAAYYIGTEARMAKLEDAVEYIQRDVAQMRCSSPYLT